MFYLDKIFMNVLLYSVIIKDIIVSKKTVKNKHVLIVLTRHFRYFRLFYLKVFICMSKKKSPIYYSR